jgi:hypothetical protein
MTLHLDVFRVPVRTRQGNARRRGVEYKRALKPEGVRRETASPRPLAPTSNWS